MENVIELKGSNRRIGIDLASGKDRNALTVIGRDEAGEPTVEGNWFFEKQLTQEEVNNLPPGSKVLILWTGGNGPFSYTVDRIGKSTFVLDRFGKVSFGIGPIDFVGKAPPKTVVWLLEKP